MAAFSTHKKKSTFFIITQTSALMERNPSICSVSKATLQCTINLSRDCTYRCHLQFTLKYITLIFHGNILTRSNTFPHIKKHNYALMETKQALCSIFEATIFQCQNMHQSTRQQMCMPSPVSSKIWLWNPSPLWLFTAFSHGPTHGCLACSQHSHTHTYNISIKFKK